MPENKLSYSEIPVPLKVLCRHCNTNYLVRETGIPLVPIQIWLFIYRRSFDIQSRHPLPAPSYQAIYIQTMHSTQDEFLLPYYKTLSDNTTIAQPDGISLIYLAEDLHCHTHGSVGMNEITNRNIILDVKYTGFLCSRYR